jgi:hypothetical protein
MSGGEVEDAAVRGSTFKVQSGREGTLNPEPETLNRVFRLDEKLLMHEFLSRFQKEFCKGVVPNFYQREVKVIAEWDGGVYVRIGAVPSPLPSPEAGEGNDEPDRGE